ncbi:MAG: energy transducer TonB [Flavobacteriaceae bacterium]
MDKKCISDEIIKIVQKNFNTDLASKLNLKGQQRIMIVFIINENGTALVDKVRAPHPELESEAKRVIELLPKFTPGEHKGKKVNVSYSLPITFMVK